MDVNNRQLATLAGGCFWCLEAVYEQLNGVELVESGYCGGHVHNPSYEQICRGNTGHAEAVQITFDSKTISYRDLVQIFFTIHDPTTLNCQGPDVGTQYRSAIFFHNTDQQATAKEVVLELEAARIWDHLIVTEIVPLASFFKAENYHQQYYRRNTYQPYCQVIIAPKIAKFRRQYLDKLNAQSISTVI